MMKRLILLLLFIPLGCSVETNAIEDSPPIVETHEKKTAVTRNAPVDSKSDVVGNCSTEPLLEMFEDYVELGVKATNLTTEKAGVSYSKLKTPKTEIKNNLTKGFGSEFSKDACAYDGLVFSLRDAREDYLGAYQITYKSQEAATEAAIFLENLDTEQLKVFKVATIFDWKLDDTTILINYHSPATTKYYDLNVREFSK